MNITIIDTTATKDATMIAITDLLFN